ncbi:VIT and VWA domain-containing protein [Verrucomicrobiales bacterium]|nr:VIT and VWA domain-containing protein [Verrucomicrobiales bacterium]
MKHNEPISQSAAQTSTNRKSLGIFSKAALMGAALFASCGLAPGAGILTPKSSSDLPIKIVDHHVAVTINNGFAQTEVLQSFSNPNGHNLEAIYRFPLPQEASLSEVTIYAGEDEIHGEVLPREKAREIYEEEKNAGNDAGLAEKDEFRSFEFRVFPVRPGQETKLRLVYYQPLEIESGIGRYMYPLEEGGTDDQAANSFWSGVSDKVEGTFSAEIELKSAWPVEGVRVPGFESESNSEKLEDGHYRLRIDKADASLDRDLVFYYRLKDDLPGRVEVVAHRADPDKPGTYMMVVTPGIDLKPITTGADYVYVLDTSGSMQGKIHTLIDGVVKSLGKMQPHDRFKVISFNNNAKEVTSGWVAATTENVERAIQELRALKTGGGTNIYDALSLATKDLDDDRATSVVLVTDGVTNAGVVDPGRFHELMKATDIRVFGFVMGNGANWPLMRTICDASGGTYSGVSNSDDIVGRILQAKEKIVHECLHDATLKIKGVRTFDSGDELLGKIYRGEQLVMFGRYEKGGRAKLSLKARLTGEDKTYTTEFDFPDQETTNPEIERLWALNQIEQIEAKANAGIIPDSEGATAVRDLGTAYQLVTDETSMVVLSDTAFTKRGIERKNASRVAVERQAQAVRSQRPANNYRVDNNKPLTPGKTKRNFGGGGGGGGGALNPFAVFAMLLVLAVPVLVGRKSK